MGRRSAMPLPEGTVTLLFSDIEGSTRLLHEIGEVYGEVLADHHRLLREVWDAHGGVEVDTEGDAFFVALADARSAVRAAAAAQEALAAHRWPHGGELRVRMGIHTGTPRIRDGTYWGIDVHYAARLCSAAHGGQVLLSASTRALADDMPADDLGEHSVKDFPSARRLYHLVVGGRTSREFPPPRTPEATRTNLPSVTSSLVGRERELEEVCAQLTGGVRLLTLTGVGGTGKTRLALAVGSALLNSFADGVFLVALASVGEERLVSLAVARAIGGAVEDDLDPEQGIIRYLGTRELLLVVDNVEHLLGSAPLLARLVEAAPGLHVLATSQTPLRVRGEVLMPLESLEVPAAGEEDPDALASVASVALFAERARLADPRFALEAANAAAVAELCRRLDGLPLALELAAARVRMGGPRQLLAALERGMDALGTGARDVPDRQRGLRAALDWTVSLLGEAERALFAGLGVFAEAWTLDQVERMLGDELDVWEASAALHDFSLIRTRGDGRFTMAETVRAYAQDLLEQQGRAHERHAQHALLLAREAEAIHDEIMLDMGLVARTTDLLREFLAALEWTAAADPALHCRLVAALGVPFYFASRLSVLADEILALSEDSAGVADDAWPRLLHGRLLVLHTRGEWAASGEVAAAAAAASGRLGDHPGQALGLALGAHMLAFLDSEESVVQAGRWLREAHALIGVGTDPRLGHVLEFEEALNLLASRSLDEAEAVLTAIMAQPARTDFGALFAQSLWADCAFLRGRYHDAIERYAEMLRRLGGTQLDNQLLQVYGVATALAGLGRDREALEMLAAARGVAEREGGMDLRDDVLPEGAEALRAARLRLGEGAAEAAGRGPALDLAALVSWALSLADPATAPAS
jgi:predicted ATPase/class 3 adenylate cyclase